MGEASLYETDILAWTEEQAAALRALAGRPDLPNALDLPNVIEEIEALGWTELRAATRSAEDCLRARLAGLRRTGAPRLLPGTAMCRTT